MYNIKVHRLKDHPLGSLGQLRALHNINFGVNITVHSTYKHSSILYKANYEAILECKTSFACLPTKFLDWCVDNNLRLFTDSYNLWVEIADEQLFLELRMRWA